MIVALPLAVTAWRKQVAVLEAAGYRRVAEYYGGHRPRGWADR
ncbi:MAG: hypothetical protein WCC38_14460 [Pseudonocardiaceae bacterium]